MKHLWRALVLANLVTVGGAYAQSSTSNCAPSSANYGLCVSVGQQSATFSADSFMSLVNQISDSALASLLPAYTSTSAARVDVQLNGIPVSLAFTGSGSTLVLSVPALGINQTFSGSSRETSVKALESYLKGKDVLGMVLKEQAASSPASPVAGNPNSLMSTTVAYDFNATLFDLGGWAGGQGAAGTTGIGFEAISLKTQGRTSRAYSLPISYAGKTEEGGGQWIISLPLTTVESGGARSYHASPGLAYRMPVTKQWTITPSGRMGVVGSTDLQTVAAVYAGAIASTYVVRTGPGKLAVGNQVGHYQSSKLKVGDLESDPGIKNTVFRNGVMYSHPLGVFGAETAMEYSYIDTRYTGSKLYVDNTQEIGIAMGTAKRSGDQGTRFSAGLSVIRGASTEGVSLNLGYWH